MNSFKAFNSVFNRLFVIKSDIITNNLINKKRLIILPLNNYRLCCSSAYIQRNSYSLKLYERDFVELSVDQFKELIINDEMKAKIELIIGEYEWEKYSTLRVPINLTIDDMKDLITIWDPLERSKYINSLFKKEILKVKHKRKKLKSQLNGVRTGIYGSDGDLTYGLWHNTLFTRITKSAFTKLIGHKLRTAAMFGQKLIIDLDYDQYMQLNECRLLANELSSVYAYNKYKCEEPFDLHFTNCKPNMPTMEAIPKYISRMDSPYNMLQFHKESYLDLFPKDKLVYLSPHSDKYIESYNHNDIYIIGGIVDKSCRKHLSYIKAQKEGIRSYKLPIDEHIVGVKGRKELCLNGMIAVLNEVKMSGDWRQALRDSIPNKKPK